MNRMRLPWSLALIAYPPVILGYSTEYAVPSELLGSWLVEDVTNPVYSPMNSLTLAFLVMKRP